MFVQRVEDEELDLDEVIKGISRKLRKMEAVIERLKRIHSVYPNAEGALSHDSLKKLDTYGTFKKVKTLEEKIVRQDSRIKKLKNLELDTVIDTLLKRLVKILLKEVKTDEIVLEAKKISKVLSKEREKPCKECGNLFKFISNNAQYCGVCKRKKKTSKKKPKMPEFLSVQRR